MITYELEQLLERINIRLDEIHAETLAKFRTLTRSTGQYLKVRK